MLPASDRRLHTLHCAEAVRPFRQAVYVENVGGAGGNIGTGQAAKAPPDGYTVLIAVNRHVINPTLYDRVPGGC
jgi:tripartite-type tricarboxylate transporter receptor subunit TctC